MRTLNNDAGYCTQPEIIASRLTSIRNIYLRQELCTISNQIQGKYKERLPVLHLVSMVAYEQVFNRQPLSLPEDLRRDAVKYGLKYYQLNIDKLRMAEAQNGLYPNHDRLSCVDKNCPLHELNALGSNHNLSGKTKIDENQSKLSDSQRSVSFSEAESEQNSNGSSRTSTTSDNTFDSTATDTSSTDKSTTISTDEHRPSSTSTFSDTNISSSSTRTSSAIGLRSSSIDPFSKSTSTRSITPIKIGRSSASTKKLSRRKPPKIIIRRPSDNSLASNNSKDSSLIAHGKQIPAKQKSMHGHRRATDKRKSRKKRKKASEIRI